MDSEQLIDIGLYGAMILLVIAVLAAVLMNLFNALNNPKSLIKSGIGIGALLAIFFIGYATASTEISGSIAQSLEAAEIDPTGDAAVSMMKIVGGAFTTVLALMIIAALGLIYSTVSKLVS